MADFENWGWRSKPAQSSKAFSSLQSQHVGTSESKLYEQTFTVEYPNELFLTWLQGLGNNPISTFGRLTA